MHETVSKYFYSFLRGKVCHKGPCLRLENYEENLSELNVFAISDHVFEILAENKFDVLYHLKEILLSLWSQNLFILIEYFVDFYCLLIQSHGVKFQNWHLNFHATFNHDFKRSNPSIFNSVLPSTLSSTYDHFFNESLIILQAPIHQILLIFLRQIINFMLNNEGNH